MAQRRALKVRRRRGSDARSGPGRLHVRTEERTASSQAPIFDFFIVLFMW
jgi:hypothetical protein